MQKVQILMDYRTNRERYDRQVAAAGETAGAGADDE